MRLSLSEIRANAMRFAAEWRDAGSERAEAQTFWNELFQVFGIHRRSVASFEERVRNLKGRYDRIDVFYSGVMLGEHKSRGEDLSLAASQAFDYVQSLTREGRDVEIPRYIVVSDFARVAIHDSESVDAARPLALFHTDQLHENIAHFGFLSGYSTKPVDPEDPVNIEAVEILGVLHDELEQGGYCGHELERFLVRVLFCLFADDTGIFEPDAFKNMVESTRRDGSDLGPMLARLFDVLDRSPDARPAGLPEELRELPWVNGALFAERLGFADFHAAMRDALLECCRFRWSHISPAVFGSLFQSILAGEAGRKKRRQIGAHYTSERDILKLVRSLFLDDLNAEFKACADDKRKLEAFHAKLAGLRFLDPACGCGNFLVVAYRELRLLELEIVQRLHPPAGRQERFNLDAWLKLDVDQMHGIEIEEWPARIAEVAMWLVDHQMNQRVGAAFGQPVLRLPLRKSAKIVHGNALRIDWNDVLPVKKCSYVMGNPPFVGKQFMAADQERDMTDVCGHIKGYGLLDYVTAWYVTGARYLKSSAARAAFVSTNSICQGEQAAVIWPELLKSGVQIHFAHRTFAWMSEVRGKAHVHVVIVGFATRNGRGKTIVDYGDDETHPTTTPVSRINPYLVEGPNVVVTPRTTPICHVPPIVFGSMPNDGGHLLLSDEERAELLRTEPAARAYLRRIFGSEEFINGIRRWCLWLVDCPAAELRRMPEVMKRVAAVKKHRLASRRPTTQGLAETPALFGEIRQPATRYLLIPSVSSEDRRYIPIGFCRPDIIASNLALVVPGATMFHFGVLTSAMHMAWVRQVCGRLKSDFRYSNKLVYNNFPWPRNGSEKQKAAVEAAARAVLDTRDRFKGQTLADLYDPLAMPKALRDAHKLLDRAVDKCYRAAPFASERHRVEYLFDLYQHLSAPLTAPVKSRPRRRAT
ncbi:MAG: DNA methyltransferase [Phycisphaerae bacterium]